MTYYYTRMQTGTCDLVLSAEEEDGPLLEAEVQLLAQLAVQTWNQRLRARHCEHDWQDIAGEGIEICFRCKTLYSAWEQQLKDEAMQGLG